MSLGDWLSNLFGGKKKTTPAPAPAPAAKPVATALVLKRGDKGNSVHGPMVQLAALGYYKATIDDDFGPKMEQAVKDFEKDHGLVQDGALGSDTMALLMAAKPPANPNPTTPAGWTPPSITVNSPRHLQKELELAIDAQLVKAHAAELKAAIEAKDCLTIVSLAAQALAEMQVREATNNNDGKWVELIQKTTNGSKGDAWCMDEQQTVVAYAEKKTGIVSRLPMSAACDEVRARCPKDMQVAYQDSKRGYLWVWVHLSGSGHTGNFWQWITAPKTAKLFEGNTTAGKIGDKIVREGGGSYQTERTVDTSKTSDMRLAMVINPFP